MKPDEPRTTSGMLEWAARAPRGVIGTNSDVKKLQTFLNGFAMACYAFGYKIDLNVRREIYYAHGWEMHSDGIVGQMREKGLTEEEMFEKLLRYEIEMWKKVEASKNTL